MNNRAMLLDLFKQEDEEILYWLQKCTSNQFKEIVIGALKEQDRDTRHACAFEALDQFDYNYDNSDSDMVLLESDDVKQAIHNCNKAVEDLKGI